MEGDSFEDVGTVLRARVVCDNLVYLMSNHVHVKLFRSDFNIDD